MRRTDAPRRHEGGDDGFTLMEVIISVAIVAVVMLGLGAVFVATASGTDAQGLRATAARVAQSGIDQARALTGANVLRNRTQASSQTQWNARPAGVSSLLSGLSFAYDPAPQAGVAPALPTTPTTSTVDGEAFQQSFYIATCALDGTAKCLASASLATGTVPMLDVVVAVAWRDTSCPKSACSYQLSTLLAATSTEPLFNSNIKAVGPTVATIANQVLDITEKITGPAVTFAGGNGAVTLTASGLPDGIRLDPDTGVFTGTANVLAAASTVTVTATDRFGLYSSQVFTWTVNPLPAVTSAAVPLVAGLLQTVNLGSALKLTGGTGPYTWSCTGLTLGATLNATTGLLSVPAAALGLLSPVCTVKDARGKTSSATLTASLTAPLTITNPATDPASTTITRITTVNSTLTASGCSGTCTWTADKLPVGISLSSAGVLTGRPTAVGTTKTTFTVRDAAGRTDTTVLTWTVAF